MRPQIKRLVVLSVICALFGIVALGAGFYFLYMQGVDEASQRLEQVKQKLDAANAKIAEISKLEEERHKAELKSEKAKLQIPPFSTIEFDAFLARLQDMARETGVTLREPKQATGLARAPAAGGAPQDIVEANYEVTATGEFKRLFDFLKVLENSVRFVRIDTLTFAKGKEGTAQEKEFVSLMIKLTVYAMRPPPAVATVAGAPGSGAPGSGQPLTAPGLSKPSTGGAQKKTQQDVTTPIPN